MRQSLSHVEFYRMNPIFCAPLIIELDKQLKLFVLNIRGVWSQENSILSRAGVRRLGATLSQAKLEPENLQSWAESSQRPTPTPRQVIHKWFSRESFKVRIDKEEEVFTNLGES